jgi:hypothetical protein
MHWLVMPLSGYARHIRDIEELTGDDVVLGKIERPKVRHDMGKLTNHSRKAEFRERAPSPKALRKYPAFIYSLWLS